MRKYLIKEIGNFYKANLHCHTTVSDGVLTPKEIKIAYMEKGYSIVAYTDHNVMISHDELNDDGFLALKGYEIDFEDENGLSHLCLISKTRVPQPQVCWHRSKYLDSGNVAKYIDKVKFDSRLPDFEREYSPECINEMIKRAHKSGFFVTLNHPTFSRETYKNYTKYVGLDAVEIVNTSSVVTGSFEYNGRVYEDLLMSSKNIRCIAADDNHNFFGPLFKDSFGAFTVIKSEELSYEHIIKSLEEKDFYCSTGPEIFELYIEDGKVCIKCSGAKTISFITPGTYARAWRAEENNFLNYAEFALPKSGWFRLEVVDNHKERAYTNAYYV